MNATDLEAALQACWSAPMPPEFIVMDRRSGERFKVISEEVKRLREVTTPLGLARLFPALRR